MIKKDVPSLEDIKHYLDVCMWQSWNDNVARFNHFKLRPIPSIDVMRGYRRVKKYVESEESR